MEMTLIIIGTFFRGPNWNFFGPFEWWDPHKLEVLNNINLSEYFWIIMLEKPMPQNVFIREFIGFLLTGFYLFVLPLLLAKTFFKNMFNAYGPIRYTFLMLFGLSMLSLPIKMYLRWFFNLKYIIAIPEYFFNI